MWIVRDSKENKSAASHPKISRTIACECRETDRETDSGCCEMMPIGIIILQDIQCIRQLSFNNLLTHVQFIPNCFTLFYVVCTSNIIGIGYIVLLINKVRRVMREKSFFANALHDQSRMMFEF